MRFSIIVPVYKVEKYLEQCVDSILEHTIRSMEKSILENIPFSLVVAFNCFILKNGNFSWESGLILGKGARGYV